MATPNLRYVTLSDDPSSNHVIFETDKYNIKLNENLFQVLKNTLSMNDNEILHVYNEIMNILDKSTIKFLLQAESYKIQHNYELITFDPCNINEDMVESFDKLKMNFEMIFDKIKTYCYQKNIQTINYYESNEAIDKLNKVCNIIVESFYPHSIYSVSGCLRIITNNIIEEEKERLMQDEIKEAFKRNENVITIDSCAKELPTVIVYLSSNNEMILAKMKKEEEILNKYKTKYMHLSRFQNKKSKTRIVL